METFEVVCRYDEAIDAESVSPADREKYRNTGDTKLLKFTDGEAPARFHCRRLRASEMQAVREQTSEPAMFAAAFSRGLQRATGVRQWEGGKRVRKDWVRPTDRKLITTAELDQFFDFGDIQEVGASIYGRSVLGEGRPAAWPLPATSRLAVEGLVSHRVAEIVARAVNSPPSKSEAEAPAPTQLGP